MKKNMLKRTIIALLTAIVCMFSFTGCFLLTDYLFEEDDDYGYTEEEDEKEPSSHDFETISSDKRASSLTLEGDGSITINRKTRKNSKPMGEDGTWTVFVYLCGTDLESEQASGSDDLYEMIEASTTENVKFVVETGGCSEWYDYGISDSSLQRYVICDGEMELVDEVYEDSMGKAETLSDFVKWGVKSYPAAKMGLVLWNHGGGSITGVCFDENFDSDSLSVADIDNALTEAYDYMSDSFEFVGFDACLMANIETANMLTPHARYMYASEETEPGNGWDYTAIGDYLGENPYCNGDELGKAVADGFYEACKRTDEENTATFSVTDLSKIDNLLQKLNTVAASMYESSDDSSSLASMVRGITSAKNYGGNNKTEGYTNMVDLGSLVYSVSSVASGTDEALAALDEAVIYNIYGIDEEGSTGLTTYYPLSISGSQELIIFKEICVSPYYMAFIDKIAYGSSNGGILDGYSGGEIWLSEGSCYWSEDEWSDDYCSSWDGLDESSGDDMEFAEDSGYGFDYAVEPHINDDGYYTFTMSADSIDNVYGVYCSIYRYDENTGNMYDLGTDNYVYVDWDTGLVEDMFDGLWYTLPDGQELAMYVIEDSYDYTIFTSPILLNGKPTNLRIKASYTDEDTYYEVIGAWDGIDENGQAAKSVIKLEQGDKITPVFDVYDENGDYVGETYGEDYSYNGDSGIYLDYMPEADYLYSFEIDDIFGNTYYTDFTTFYVDENGDIYFY